MTRLDSLTPEHLGPDATDQDVATYRRTVARVAAERNISEDEAADLVWGNGDWWPWVTDEDQQDA